MLESLMDQEFQVSRRGSYGDGGSRKCMLYATVAKTPLRGPTKPKQNVIFRQFYRRIFLRSLGISRASGPPYGPINLRAQLSERELVAHDRACLQPVGEGPLGELAY